MKKIIFIVGAGVFSGKEIVSINLMESLKQRGHDVYCITSSWGSNDFGQALEKLHIPYTRVRLGFISKQFTFSAIKMTLHQILYLPKVLFDTMSIFKSFKPDVIIHSNFHHTFLLYPILNKKSKQFYHIHESYNNSRFYNRLFNFLNRKIDHFIGVSNFVSDKLQTIIGNRPTIIYNGLNIKIKRNIPIQLDRCNLGIIGQIGTWKGHEDLIHAVALLNKQEKENLKVHIFGNHLQNLFADHLKKMIKEYDMENNFVWRGFVKNQSDIYESLNIVCVPSRSNEPLATTAIEAGLFSIPVITTTQGGLPEIITDGINGFLASSNSPELLSIALQKLINNKQLIIELGNNHRKCVTEKFSLKMMTDKFELLF